MKRNLSFLSALLFSALFFNAAAQTGKSRPDIIIIMADDMGYSDIGCYGGDVNTPNLDKLAKNGLRMTNFYNNARCCPTRASLLTGQYAHKVGLAANGNALTRNGATIPELLKDNGYQTGMVGKWHLSDDIQQPTKEEQLKWLNHQGFADAPFASVESYPINRGFQKHYGIVWGVIDYFDPFSLVDGEKNVKEVPKDYYITDAINEKSVEYINEFISKKQPYFLYVAYTAPHWPVHARPEDIAKYKGKYDLGWDEVRKQRYNRMVKMGLIDPKSCSLIDVMGRFGTWDKMSKEEKEKQARKMETHAAMIDRLDQGVGQIIEALKKAKTLDNTLIIFLADNGASPEIVNLPGYDRPSQTRNGQPMHYDAEVKTEEIGSEISYTMIGPNWANAANTPYKYWKMESYEGGIHTPMIVHWPAGLKTRKGSLNNAMGHVTDILPTLLDLTNTKYPDQYHNNKLTSLDGFTLLPVFKGKTTKGRDSIFFQHANGMAYINGNWKIVSKTGNTPSWELYDLSRDKNETKNLSAQYPDLFNQMIASWNRWYGQMKPYIKLRPGSGPR
jgi:arylsulfatase